MSREELILLVQRILDADGTEEELDQLQASVPDLNVSDLIFWHKAPELTVEEVVDKALSYKPIAL